MKRYSWEHALRSPQTAEEWFEFRTKPSAETTDEELQSMFLREQATIERFNIVITDNIYGWLVKYREKQRETTNGDGGY